jgi:hypothetical protein
MVKRGFQITLKADSFHYGWNNKNEYCRENSFFHMNPPVLA